MRIDEIALRHIALNRKADHQGMLSYQSPKDIVKEKHCKLIGNLLFFYKPVNEPDHKNSVDGFGLLVLEQCIVQKVGEKGQLGQMFYILFQGDPYKKHYFTAPSSQECEKWITALNTASYTFLQAELQRLRTQIQRISGNDPWVSTQKHILADIRKKVSAQCPTSKHRKDTFGKDGSHIATGHKHKSKGSSKFYIDPRTGFKQVDKEHKIVTSGSDTTQQGMQKSRFFRDLNVIQAPGRNGLLASDNLNKPVSSHLEKLRNEARKVALSKPEMVTSCGSVSTSSISPTEVENPQQKNAICGDGLNFDLIDFSQLSGYPSASQDTTKTNFMMGTCLSQSKKTNDTLTQATDITSPRQNPTSNVLSHGQALHGSQATDRSSKEVQGVRSLLDFDMQLQPAGGSFIDQQAPPAQLKAPATLSHFGNNGNKNEVDPYDLSFLENGLSNAASNPASDLSERFKSWEKF